MNTSFRRVESPQGLGGHTVECTSPDGEAHLKLEINSTDNPLTPSYTISLFGKCRGGGPESKLRVEGQDELLLLRNLIAEVYKTEYQR